MKSILLVHDQQSDVWERKNSIEASGYRVILANRFQDCLERIREYQPDLILMDVLLEGPNGFAVARKLNKTPEAKDIPLLLCSGIYRAPRFREEAIAAGARDYLVTPIELPELISKITSYTAEEIPRKRPISRPDQPEQEITACA